MCAWSTATASAAYSWLATRLTFIRQQVVGTQHRSAGRLQPGVETGTRLGRCTDGLLDTYETERLPIAAAVLGLSKRLQRTATPCRGKETQQLSLHYRDSALARDTRNASGDCAPGTELPMLFARSQRSAHEAVRQISRDTIHTAGVRWGGHREAATLCALSAWSTTHRRLAQTMSSTCRALPARATACNRRDRDREAGRPCWALRRCARCRRLPPARWIGVTLEYEPTRLGPLPSALGAGTDSSLSHCPLVVGAVSFSSVS